MESVTLKKILYKLLWAFIIALSLYYIYANCLRYFVFEPKNYHESFFWNRRYWLFVHVISGMVATIVVPLQFIPALRIRFRRAHRIIGNIYLISIIISSITSFYLCATTPENTLYALGLGGFTAAWLLTTVIGYYQIIKGNLEQHKLWMIRSFIVTIGFSISRMLEDIVIEANAGGTRDARLTILAWVSWIIPLAITEIIIRRNYIRKQHIAIAS